MQNNLDLSSPLLGKLSWDAIPLHEPILLATFAMVALGGMALLAAMTYFRWWGPLWRDWITSIEHKKIGIMYIILGVVMLLRGFADALMMRAHQAMSFGEKNITRLSRCAIIRVPVPTVMLFRTRPHRM